MSIKSLRLKGLIYLRSKIPNHIPFLFSLHRWRRSCRKRRKDFWNVSASYRPSGIIHRRK